MDKTATSTGVTAVRSRRRGIKVRVWILGSGAFAGLAIVLMSLVVLRPLGATRADLRHARDGVPLQAELIALRTTVVEWRFYIERHLDVLRPDVAPRPVDLVKASELAKAQAADETVVARHLPRVKFVGDARKLDAAMSAFRHSPHNPDARRIRDTDRS